MSEIPEYPYHDGESSASEKDSVYDFFGTFINFFELIYEKVPKDLPKFKDLIEKHKDVISTLKQAKDAYDQSPKYLEIRYDFDEVSSRLTEEFNKEYEASLNAFMSSLDKIFPANIAEVNVPKYCNFEGCKIPKVKKFQRNNNLNPDVADSEYIRLALGTKKAVIDGVYEEDDTSSSIEFEISQPEYNPVRENTDRLVKLLANFSALKSNEFDAMRESKVGVRMERVEDFFNYERDLKWANAILDCVNEMKDLNEESWARKYTEIVFEENCSNVQTFAKSMVEEKAKLILERELRVLSEKFTTYKVAPEIARNSLGKATEKKRSNKPESRAEESSRPVEIGLKAGDVVELDNETFPWLKEDSIVNILHIEQGNGGTVVAVVDARTKEAKGIEHEMTGYENNEKKQDILPIIKEKLIMAAKCVATSRNKSVGLPVGLKNNKSKELYPFIIYAWKDRAHDAKRVYMSKVSVENMSDKSETKRSLQETGVTEVILFLGACDKQNQKSLVALFMDGDARDAAKYGAGA